MPCRHEDFLVALGEMLFTLLLNLRFNIMRLINVHWFIYTIEIWNHK